MPLNIPSVAASQKAKVTTVLGQIFHYTAAEIKGLIAEIQSQFKGSELDRFTRREARHSKTNSDEQPVTRSDVKVPGQATAANDVVASNSQRIQTKGSAAFIVAFLTTDPPTRKAALEVLQEERTLRSAERATYEAVA